MHLARGSTTTTTTRRRRRRRRRATAEFSFSSHYLRIALPRCTPRPQETFGNGVRADGVPRKRSSRRINVPTNFGLPSRRVASGLGVSAAKNNRLVYMRDVPPTRRSCSEGIVRYSRINRSNEVNAYIIPVNNRFEITFICQGFMQTRRFARINNQMHFSLLLHSNYCLYCFYK